MRMSNHNIQVKMCFVIGGKAYHTLRTATQAVANRLVENLWWKSTKTDVDRKRIPYMRQRELNAKAYRRVKPIVAKIFPKETI